MQYDQGSCFQKNKVYKKDVSSAFAFAFVLHSDLKPKLNMVWEPRERSEDVLKLVDNEYAAVAVLLDNVGQMCGVHVS